MNNKFSERPWGRWDMLYQEKGYWVKRIEVQPRKRLSLQFHEYRSEDWIIVKGYGIATVEGEVIFVSNGCKIHIRPKQIHRIENSGPEPLVFIEVATGDPLEDDIVRLDDDYGRA